MYVTHDAQHPFSPLTAGGRSEFLFLRDEDEVDEWVVIASVLLSLGEHVLNMPPFSLFL